MPVQQKEVIVSPYNQGGIGYFFFYIVNNLLLKSSSCWLKPNIYIFMDEDVNKTFQGFKDYLKENYNGVWFDGEKKIKEKNSIVFSNKTEKGFENIILYFIKFIDYKKQPNIISVFYDLSFTEKLENSVKFALLQSIYSIAIVIIRENFMSVYEYLSYDRNQLIFYANLGFKISLYSDIIAEETSQNYSDNMIL